MRALFYVFRSTELASGRIVILMHYHTDSGVQIMKRNGDRKKRIVPLKMKIDFDFHVFPNLDDFLLWNTILKNCAVALFQEVTVNED